MAVGALDSDFACNCGRALAACALIGNLRTFEQCYNWDASGRRFVELVEKTVAQRRTLPPAGD